ncbi:MAG: glycosyltransferase, partial [Haliea sp.]
EQTIDLVRDQPGGPETFGRTVVEAWAHRKPVVAYAVGAPAGLITHEVDGLLVEEGDTRGLAEALWRVSSSPALCRRLGAAGHDKANRRFSAQVVIPQLMHQLKLS